MANRPLTRPTTESAPSFPAETIETAVKSVRFGVVQLIIQDGRVVQIDRTAKIRLA